MSSRVLVIDDDDLTREVIASMLKESGHQVFELPSPIGATRVITRERVEIVLLDVFMPQMDGDKFAKMLRENARLPRVTIVLISACDPMELSEIAIRVKADAVVSKAEINIRLLPVVARLAGKIKVKA